MQRRTVKFKVGRVAARRVLNVKGPADAEVIITIGVPRRSRSGRWECLFLIEGLGRPQVESVGGEDSLQALLLAVGMVRLTLEQTGHSFEWIAAELGSGIPLQAPISYGPRFERRVNLFIEREAKRVIEARLKRNKMDIGECETELKQRKKLIVALEAALKRRKTAVANVQANLRNWKPGRSRDA